MLIDSTLAAKNQTYVSIVQYEIQIGSPILQQNPRCSLSDLILLIALAQERHVISNIGQQESWSTASSGYPNNFCIVHIMVTIDQKRESQEVS